MSLISKKIFLVNPNNYYIKNEYREEIAVKNQYSSLVLELVLYEEEDIITTSGVIPGDAQQDFYDTIEDPWITVEGQ